MVDQLWEVGFHSWIDKTCEKISGLNNDCEKTEFFIWLQHYLNHCLLSIMCFCKRTRLRLDVSYASWMSYSYLKQSTTTILCMVCKLYIQLCTTFFQGN